MRERYRTPWTAAGIVGLALSVGGLVCPETVLDATDSIREPNTEAYIKEHDGVPGLDTMWQITDGSPDIHARRPVPVRRMGRRFSKLPNTAYRLALRAVRS